MHEHEAAHVRPCLRTGDGGLWLEAERMRSDAETFVQAKQAEGEQYYSLKQGEAHDYVAARHQEADLQADGGTHVRSTSEVGRIRIVDYKSKGKINKRIYVDLASS